MKVIVFGGGGFLGSHVADHLTASNYAVKIFDLKKSPYLKLGQEMIIGDIMNPSEVLKAIKGCDYVYNFAGISNLDDAATKPIDTVKSNIIGNINILEASMRMKVKRLIYASTIYVYSNKGGFYRCSKQASEIYIEEFYNRYALDYTILRYGTVYGPRADNRNSIYRYIRQAIKEKRIDIPGTGDEFREYINVRDAAKLSVDILSPEFKNRYLIITGHHPVKLKYLISTIEEIFNRPLDIFYNVGANPHHYNITPYSYLPKLGEKLTTNCYIDLGQGLLECFQDVDNQE